jgi:hypothetical protein
MKTHFRLFIGESKFECNNSDVYCVQQLCEYKQCQQTVIEKYEFISLMRPSFSFEYIKCIIIQIEQNMFVKHV